MLSLGAGHTAVACPNTTRRAPCQQQAFGVQNLELCSVPILGDGILGDGILVESILGDSILVLLLPILVESILVESISVDGILVPILVLLLEKALQGEVKGPLVESSMPSKTIVWD